MIFNQPNYEIISSLPPIHTNLGNSFWANKPENAFVSAIDRSEFQPYPLPFPGSRLHNLVYQMNDSRTQLLDPKGSFILTNVDQLPSGGQKISINIESSNLELDLVGDIGEPGLIQQSVAHALIKRLEVIEPNVHALVCGLGDWMYPCAPANDGHQEILRAHKGVLDLYQRVSRHAMLIGIIGNHEYGYDGEMADLETFIRVANEKQVQIPGRYYELNLINKNWNVDIYALDTSTLAVDSEQIKWLRGQLSDSLVKERLSGKHHWRIMLAHHPINSSGTHKEENLFIGEVLSDLLPNFDLCVSGHDHFVELRKANDQHPMTFICGTGSQVHDWLPKSDSLYFSNKPAFGVIRITDQGLSIGVKTINVDES